MKALRDRDRAVAAIHEAGHLVACEAFRCPASAVIYERAETDPRRDRGWGGHCQTARYAMSDWARRPKDWLSLVGAAGLMAECAAERGAQDGTADLDTVLCAFDDLLASDPLALSESDRMLMGERFTSRQAARTARLIVARWDRVVDVAKALAATGWAEAIVQARTD